MNNPVEQILALANALQGKTLPDWAVGSIEGWCGIINDRLRLDKRLDRIDASIATQLQHSIERNSRLVNRVKHLESFCANSAEHVTDGTAFADHVADCCRKIALDEGTP